MTKTIEERIVALEEQSKTLFNSQEKQDKVLEAIYSISENMKELNANIIHSQKDIDDMKKDIELLQGAVGREWKHVMQSIIGTIIGAIIGFLLSRFGIL